MFIHTYVSTRHIIMQEICSNIKMFHDVVIYISIFYFWSGLFSISYTFTYNIQEHYTYHITDTSFFKDNPWYHILSHRIYTVFHLLQVFYNNLLLFVTQCFTETWYAVSPYNLYSTCTMVLTIVLLSHTCHICHIWVR